LGRGNGTADEKFETREKKKKRFGKRKKKRESRKVSVCTSGVQPPEKHASQLPSFVAYFNHRRMAWGVQRGRRRPQAAHPVYK
jgi:hypothetical protein